jgi:hypothetical protein
MTLLRGEAEEEAEPNADLRPEDDLRPAGALVTTELSTIVFHAPQPGQRPCHLLVSNPQSLQKKTVFSFIFIIPGLIILFL